MSKKMTINRAIELVFILAEEWFGEHRLGEYVYRSGDFSDKEIKEALELVKSHLLFLTKGMGMKL